MPRVMRSIVERVYMGKANHENDQRPEQGRQEDAG